MAIMLTDFIETETHLRNSAPGLTVWVFPDTQASELSHDSIL